MVGTTDQGNWKTIRFVKFLWGYCSDCHPQLPSWRASCRSERTADQSQSRCWELLRTGLRAANSVSEVGPGGQFGAGGVCRPGRDIRLALNLSVAARTRLTIYTEISPLGNTLARETPAPLGWGHVSPGHHHQGWRPIPSGITCLYQEISDGKGQWEAWIKLFSISSNKYLFTCPSTLPPPRTLHIPW